MTEKKVSIDFITILNAIESFQLILVQAYGFVLQWIQIPSSTVKIESFCQNPDVIQFKGNPTKELQLEAVQLNVFSIYGIENPCVEAQLFVVRLNPSLSQFIKNPLEEMQVALINQILNTCAIRPNLYS